MSFSAKLLLLGTFALAVNIFAIRSSSLPSENYLSDISTKLRTNFFDATQEEQTSSKIASNGHTAQALASNSQAPKRVLAEKTPAQTLPVASEQQLQVNTQTQDSFGTASQSSSFFPNLPGLSTTASNDTFSPPVNSGIDGTGGLNPPSDNGIDGTGGQNPPTDNGIDGTGEPQNAGVDGSGGPEEVPEEDKGIDGTGGEPKDEPQELLLPKKETLIAPVKEVEAVGVLNRQDNLLIVNGLHFDLTDDTNTTINGETEEKGITLSSGQVVNISGSVDDFGKGTAREVTHTTRITGEITSLSSQSIGVLGQLVTLEHGVVYGGSASSLTSLRIGDVITVSGFVRSNGALSATRIDRIESQINQLVGSVSNLNELDNTFVVNELTVDYSQVETPPVLSEGSVVNVTGLIDEENSLRLNAQTLTITSSLSKQSAERVELEGLITEVIVASKETTSIFKIGDVTVSANLQTEIVGNDREDLILNAKIEVEGQLNSEGVLVAEKILFLIGNITSHNHRDRLEGETVTFHWTDVRADAYHIQVHGGTRGEQNYLYEETFDGNVTSATINGLPENSSRVIFELFTKQGEFWYRKAYDFVGSGRLDAALLTSHEQFGSLSGTTETFTWNTVDEADGYRLRVYNYYSNIDYFNQTFEEPEPVTLHDLPTNGADVNVELLTNHNGWWSRASYDLKSVQLQENATLTSHTNGQKLDNKRQTFTWKDVGAEEYEIRVARTTVIGWFDILDIQTLDGSTTSYTVDNLPTNNAEVYIRLRTKHDGWATQYYKFYGTEEKPSAELITHKNRETLSSSSQTFSWTQVPEADAYHLVIHNLVADGAVGYSEDFENFVTSQTIHNLPKNNAPVLLHLHTLVDGFWGRKSYQLHGTGELPHSVITSHKESDVIRTKSIEVTWTDVGASEYRLYIVTRTGPFIRVIRQNFGSDVTSATVDNIPDDVVLRMSIYAKHGDWWSDYGFNVTTDIP